ncbi:MAG: pantetheine-phosphate adenylyltransferase [Clostridia bacterium]|nr:pantetheine-phosphate adenylyltransferase [Clostridia bacterium]
MADNSKVCLVPGSFDPPTLGHRYVAEHAAKTYSRVLVVGFINEAKEYTFSEEERLELMKAQFGDLPNVTVGFSRGMLADYCRENGVDVILKGIRNKKDEAYEIDMAEKNYARYSGAVTVLLKAPEDISSVSSTAVREILANGGDASPLLGARVAELACVFYKNNGR